MSEFATGWLDTNMILRYLLGEPQDQAQAAASIIEQSSLVCDQSGHSGGFFVLSLFIGAAAQILWIRWPRLVNRENVQVSHIEKALVIDALYMCRDSGRVKVADALLWAEARTAGPATIYTFDRRFPIKGHTIRKHCGPIHIICLDTTRRLAAHHRHRRTHRRRAAARDHRRLSTAGGRHHSGQAPRRP